MVCVVYLESDVDSFRIGDGHYERLKKEFPGWKFVPTRTRDEFLYRLPDADIVITWKFRQEWYAGASQLKAVYTPAAGHDWTDADPSGRVRTVYGSFHKRIIGESFVAMILYFNRRLDAAVAAQRESEWDRHPYTGTSVLAHRHVMIVGYGTIGRECARVIKPFGCRITGVRRTPVPGEEGDADEVIAFSEIDRLLPAVDHIAFILPIEANEVFTDKHFAKLKRGAYLYNLGRGNCYREFDLINALREGKIAGAGLDVFETEPLPVQSVLWLMTNVLILPHSSAISSEYLDFYLDELIPKLKEEA